MACSLQFIAVAGDVPLGLIAYTVLSASPEQLHVLDTLNNSVSVVPLACANPIRREPQWTPGSEWIVFAGGPSLNSQIYKVRPDGSDCQRITDGIGDLTSPTLSPDGGRIVYSGGDLYVINIDGSGKTNLGFQMSYPHWSPCGDKLLASDWAYGGGYNSDLWVYEFETGKLTKITAHGDGEAYVQSAWSPDCAKIAAVFKHDGQSDIVLMNTDGSSMRNLTGDWSTSNEDSPCWSPDGQFILFASDRSGNWDIWAMHPDGSARTNLTQTAGIDEYSPAVAPNVPSSYGLVAFYPLAGNAMDASGHANHGTVMNATFASDACDCFSPSIDLDGSGDWVVVADSSSLDLTSWTLSVWLMPRESGRYQAILTKSGYGEGLEVDENYGLWLTADLRPRLQYEFPGSTLNFRLDGDLPLQLNAWCHLVATRDASSGRVALYLNGELQKHDEYSPIPNQQSQPLRIGARQAGAFPDDDSNYFNGRMSNLRVYERALSASEVLLLYKAEAPARSAGLLYLEDFSSAPGWTTDDVANLRWDAATGTFHGTQVNTEGTYAYIDLPMFNPNQPWCLEWDHRVNRADWSAGLDFGLMDASISYPFSAGIHMGVADGGNCIGFWGLDGVFAPIWQVGVWYHSVIRYDPATHQLSAVVSNKETAAQLWSFTRVVNTFQSDTTRLGVSRLHMKNTGPGANPSATVDYNLDNIRLYGEAAPMLAFPLPNTTVAPGSTAQFAVKAFGTQPLTYEWFFNGAPLPANGPALTVPDVSPDKAGKYCVVVRNASGAVTNGVFACGCAAPI